MATFEYADNHTGAVPAQFAAGVQAGVRFIQENRQYLAERPLNAAHVEPEPLVDLPGGIIDWHATMRDCVAEASVLADRIGTRDSEAGEAIQRLCNATAHLLDGMDAQNRIIVDLSRKLSRVESAADAALVHVNAAEGL